MTKNFIRLFLVFFWTQPTLAFSEPFCQTSPPIVTAAGTTFLQICEKKEEIYLDGKILLSDGGAIFDNDSSDKAPITIYSSGTMDPKTACHSKMYLVDLSKKPAKVIAFGVKNSCNEFDWASWGKKRSVIALQHNVRFVYEDGKLTPPKADEKLWTSVEAPHGPAASNVAEDIVPFVEDISPPQK